jgi:nucleoside phosphorylase
MPSILSSTIEQIQDAFNTRGNLFDSPVTRFGEESGHGITRPMSLGEGAIVFGSSILALSTFMQHFWGGIGLRTSLGGLWQFIWGRDGFAKLKRFNHSMRHRLIDRRKRIRSTDVEALEKIMMSLFQELKRADMSLTSTDLDEGAQVGYSAVAKLLEEFGLPPIASSQLSWQATVAIMRAVVGQLGDIRVDGSFDCDFLIIAPLEEELRAIQRCTNVLNSSELMLNPVVHFTAEVSANLTRSSSVKYRVRVMTLPKMGRVSAALEAQRAIELFTPRRVIIVGIAGGVARNGVALGDVLVAEQIVDFELQKLRSTGPEHRWQVYPTDNRMLSAARVYLDGEWRSPESRPESGVARPHIGPIASGDKVVASDGALDDILKAWPKLLGVEMEGAGAAAAAMSATFQPGIVMVRGVSDLADPAKDYSATAEWRSCACDVAAMYTIGLLGSGPVLPIGRL